MKILQSIFFLILIANPLNKLFAWAAEGHAIVGRLAMRFVKEDVRQNILSILGNNMSIDTAANWMDIMKSNADYDFMRTWHYLDFAKGQQYQPSNNENILNRLILTYSELQHKKTLCSEQIRTDLFILLHLMGDLHMPLHTGYDDDLGGNQRIVKYDTIKGHNLHTFWDVDIIQLSGIRDEDCLMYLTEDTLKNVDFVSWMQDSRSLLDQVYSFQGFELDKAYLDKNSVVVKKQLLKAGLRLALVLNKLFYTPTPLLDYKELTAKYKNGIDIYEAKNNIGKKVTVCARVASIRFTSTITQISLGEKYPNTPLTIIVFGKAYAKFKYPLEEMIKEKNICVKGTIEEYKGKAQIVVDDPDDVIIL